MQAQFFTEIDTRHLEGPNRMVLAPFSGYSERYDLTWIVPPPFVGDESSVPRLPFAYWIFGGRGNRECWPHDMMYRWPLASRFIADMIFHEMAEVRQSNLSKQSIPRSMWRWTERNAMTGAVVLGGWVAYKNYPGCLDHRKAESRSCPGKEVFCLGCDNYYSKWRQCVRPGFHPKLWREHV